MSELVRQLRNSGAVEPRQLDAAFRRQQIYGGSLDTVLLELELVTPPRLNELLALACGLPPAPVFLLKGPRERHWNAVPKDLVDLGWVMPLGVEDGKLYVAVHPELSDDKLAALRRSTPGVVPVVTAECQLARLASERTGSVMPQRYAILALRYLDAIEAEAAADASNSAQAAPAPWMSSPALERPLTVPPNEGQAPPPRPADQLPADTTQRFVPKFKPPSREADAPNMHDAERTQALFQPPPVRNPAVQSGVPEPPPYQAGGVRPRTETNLPRYDEIKERATESVDRMMGSATLNTEVETSMERAETINSEAEIASYNPPTMVGATQMAEEPIAAALHEQFYDALREINAARERDAVTDALVRAAMLISPRVALFGVKKEGLRGLKGPGAIAGIAGVVVPVTPPIEKALDGGPLVDRATDLDLRVAVQQDDAIPCVLCPIKVRDRPVLLLYVDRDGLDFNEDDAAHIGEAAEAAANSLEEVLKQMAAKREPVHRGGAASKSPEPQKPIVRTSRHPTSETQIVDPIPPLTVPTEPRKQARTHSLFSAPPPAQGPGAPESDATPPPTPEAAHAQPRLPKLIDTEIPTRPTTLVGGGGPGPDLTEIARKVAAASAQRPSPVGQAGPQNPSELRTEPGTARSPLAPPQSDGSAPEPDAGRAGPQMLTLTSSPPPPAPPPVPHFGAPGQGPPRITPLSTPLTQGTSRGQIVFDDEESTEVNETPPSDSIEARIDACLQSAMGGGAKVSDVLAFGEKALIRIASRFPGPIDVFRRDLDSLPPPSAHGPLLRLVIQLGGAIVPHVVELMDHKSPNVRFYAAFVFQALRDERCVHRLADLAFDPDNEVRAISMRVLETYSRSPYYPAALERVRFELGSDNRTRQLHAARALGTLRDVEAVALLIDGLSSEDRYIQEASLESLCSITGQQLGLKPHRWKKWFTENGGRHRVEWIMSSLQHRDVNVRRWAADELRRITGQDIDFPAAADQALRDAALRRWMEWWHNQGRVMFGA